MAQPSKYPWKFSSEPTGTHPILEGVGHILTLAQAVDEVDQVQVGQLSIETFQLDIKVGYFCTVHLKIDACLCGGDGG
ncbi:hypothetical protein E2C01_006411 [Portunus trituberculatus]|uniref:Uncharacterized protein n=1 Tax=Portunus trituberculatus TaxID=210409 RepID=A0A5B7CV09_PORTR|nr:hypothetical protein [Portunus trituberculatus]